jgi:hypothetical protein
MMHVHDVTYRLLMSHRKRVLADENSPVPHTPPPLQKRSSHFVNTFGTPLTNNCLKTPSQSSSFEFVDAFTPIPKRRKLRPIAAEDTPSSTRIIQDRVAAERRREQERKAFQEQEKRRLEDEEKTASTKPSNSSRGWVIQPSTPFCKPSSRQRINIDLRKCLACSRSSGKADLPGLP